MGRVTVSLIIIALVAASVKSEENCSNMLINVEDEGLDWVNCKLTLDEPSAEVTLKFSSTLVEGRAPLLKTNCCQREMRTKDAFLSQLNIDDNNYLQNMKAKPSAETSALIDQDSVLI